jgi:hypothetical protein
MPIGTAGLGLMKVLPVSLAAQIGACGTASVPRSLALVLDRADAGERIASSIMAVVRDAMSGRRPPRRI